MKAYTEKKKRTAKNKTSPGDVILESSLGNTSNEENVTLDEHGDDQIVNTINELNAPITRGILLIAAGHPYYGKMAYTLGVSIRFSDPEISMTLAYTDGALKMVGKDEILKVFNNLVCLEKEMYTRGDKDDWIKAKTFLYDLSPYDETLFLDADMVWLPRKKVSTVFDELKDIEFTIANHESFDLENLPKDLNIWASVEEVKKAYALTGQYYSLHSEFVKFNKTARMKAYFDKVKEVFNNPLIQPMKWGTSIPDEFAFSVACALTRVYPHKTPYHPTFWMQMQFDILKRRPKLEELYRDFCALSIGGVSQEPFIVTLYNNLVKYYFNQLKKSIALGFSYKPKKRFLQERKSI